MAIIQHSVWVLKICFLEVLAALQILPYSVNMAQQLNRQGSWCLGLSGNSEIAMVTHLFEQQQSRCQNRAMKRRRFFWRLGCHKPEPTFRSHPVDFCTYSERKSLKLLPWVLSIPATAFLPLGTMPMVAFWRWEIMYHWGKRELPPSRTAFSFPIYFTCIHFSSVHCLKFRRRIAFISASLGLACRGTHFWATVGTAQNEELDLRLNHNSYNPYPFMDFPRQQSYLQNALC